MVTPTSNPLGYLGIDSPDPRETWYRRHAPTQHDFRPYTVGDRWIDTTNQNAYILVSKSNGIAVWNLLGAGAGNPLNTISGVAPIASNINLVNTGAVNITPGLGQVGLGVNVDGTTVQIIGNQLVAPGSQPIKTTKFTVNGMWSIDPLTTYVQVIAWGGGGGGGGGGSQVAGTNSFGAHGGTGGAPMNVFCEASVFPVTSTITIGTGGTGGAGSAVGNGSVGNNGTDTIVQTNTGNIIASHGSGGTGGTNAAGPLVIIGGRGIFGFVQCDGGQTVQGTTSLTPFATNIVAPGAPGGGGSAAGVNTLGVEGNGAQGASVLAGSTLLLAGGSGGLAPGGSGGNGTSFTTQAYIGAGSGGGGGAGGAAVNGGNGGNGGNRGAGGGAGGSSVQPHSGGNGGNGSNGEVWLLEYV